MANLIEVSPARQRLTSGMLNKVDQRMNELKHIASFATEISLDLVAGDGEDVASTLP